MPFDRVRRVHRCCRSPSRGSSPPARRPSLPTSGPVAADGSGIRPNTRRDSRSGPARRSGRDETADAFLAWSPRSNPAREISCWGVAGDDLRGSPYGTSSTPWHSYLRTSPAWTGPPNRSAPSARCAYAVCSRLPVLDPRGTGPADDIDVATFSATQLSRLPPMSKDDVLEHFDGIVTDHRLSLSRVEAHLGRLTRMPTSSTNITRSRPVAPAVVAASTSTTGMAGPTTS